MAWMNIGVAGIALLATLLQLFIHAPYRGALGQFFCVCGALGFAIWGAITTDELRAMVALVVSSGLLIGSFYCAREIMTNAPPPQ